MTRLVLGIDGGGTKTEAVVLDAGAIEKGAVGPTGRAGACNIAAMPVPEALASILAAAEATGVQPNKIEAIVAAVAGYSFAERREELAEEMARSFPQAAIKIVPDYMAAFTGALNGQPGVVVIAGTGSVAYGENALGQSHRAGGYGYLIDDAGSGYGVGRAALAAVLREADGTGQKTTLTERVANELGMASWEQISAGVYGGEIDRARIASLAKVVAASANEDNDLVARSILSHNGMGALTRMAVAVATRLFAEDEPFQFSTVGGLWRAGPDLTEVFLHSVEHVKPLSRHIEPVHGPAMGAALRAANLAA